MRKCPACKREISEHDGVLCPYCGQSLMFVVNEKGLVRAVVDGDTTSPLFRVAGDKVAFWDKRGKREVQFSILEIEQLLERHS